MKVNMVAIAALAGLGLWAWSQSKGPGAQAAKTVSKSPTITRYGNTVQITPAPGQPAVIPFVGAAPVQPVVYTLPAQAITTPSLDQVKVFNTNTLQVAWTDLANLPNLIAGGWIVMTEAE